MPFALLDDKFHSNAKVYAAGNAGAGLYARALSYCADHLTDGFVPAAWVRSIGTPALIKKLETVRLWQRVSSGDSFQTLNRAGVEHRVNIIESGFWIPDYLWDNPSRADVKNKRKKKADAGRKGAEKRWQTDSKDMAPAKDVLEPSHSVGNAPRFPVLPIDLNPNPNPAVDVAGQKRVADLIAAAAPDDIPF